MTLSPETVKHGILVTATVVEEADLDPSSKYYQILGTSGFLVYIFTVLFYNRLLYFLFFVTFDPVIDSDVVD